MQCELNTGLPRTEPHRDRRLASSEVNSEDQVRGFGQSETEMHQRAHSHPFCWAGFVVTGNFHHGNVRHGFLLLPQSKLCR